jgi:FkbM family methyltransferase
MKSLLKPLVERFPAISQFYRNSRDLLDRNQPSLPTPWGFTLAGSPLMASGTFEPEETQLVRQLLGEVDLLVNVGANVGYYCCHALSLGKRVVAIEPNARNLHYLMRNLVENGWAQQCEIFPVALAAQTDVLRMWGGGTGASLISGWAGTPESYVTQVPVLTLDRVLGDILRGKKALVLVDIEGAEFMMLQGARDTLINDPLPIWLIEISSNEHQPAGVAMNPNFAKTFELFFAHCYQAITADRTATQITPQVVEEITAGSQKLSVHNFVLIGCE